MKKWILIILYVQLLQSRAYPCSNGASCSQSLIIVSRALDLVGKSRSQYVCNQVVNYALTGSVNGKLAKDYLNWGALSNKPAPGYVVVGNDGKHCGIFISDSEWIHSSVSKQKVIQVSIDQLRYVFPNGYQIRRPI